MHDVTEVRFGEPCATRLWLSEQAQDEIAAYLKKRHSERRQFFKRLERYSRNGFGLFEGERSPVKHEWGGVYRVRPTASLFRIIGFYETEARTDFIGIDAFLKNGTRLSSAQRFRIDAVAAVKRTHDWRKVPSVGYP